MPKWFGIRRPDRTGNRIDRPMPLVAANPGGSRLFSVLARCCPNEGEVRSQAVRGVNADIVWTPDALAVARRRFGNGPRRGGAALGVRLLALIWVVMDGFYIVLPCARTLNFPEMVRADFSSARDRAVKIAVTQVATAAHRERQQSVQGQPHDIVTASMREKTRFLNQWHAPCRPRRVPSHGIRIRPPEPRTIGHLATRAQLIAATFLFFRPA